MDTKSAIGLLLLFNALVRGGDVSNWQDRKEEAAIALFRPQDASRGALILQQAASQGNLDAQSDLTLATLLGMGVPQDIDAAEKSSSSLVAGGGARAHTTMGLLLSHNLTGTEMTEEQRQSQALSHYIVAAMNKDPIAQILAGFHYLKVGDCEAALQYFRRAALVVAPSVSEEVSIPDPPQYVWPEDNMFSEVERPSMDEFYFLEHMASHGDPDAALKTAVLLYRGIPGLPRDIPAAAAYFQQAAKANSTSAMVMLSAVLLRHDLPQFEEDVRELLETALNLGDKSAFTYLGLLYLNGFRDIPKDTEKARKYLMMGVLDGTVEAVYLLGKLYEEESISGHSDDALLLWKMSASIGHVPSAFRVAERYWKDLHQLTSNTVPKSNTAVFAQALCHEAVAMYRKVALSGDWLHLLDSAYSDYLDGRIAPALLKYLLMSDMGYPSAHVNAGRLLDAGSDGVFKSEDALHEQARKVWQKAADTGAASGYIRMGDLYYYGQGVPRDLAQAAMYYSNASKLGSPHGLFSAAQMVEWGEGSVRNITKARELYEAAYELSEDAAVPVTLALLRMDIFLSLNDTFGLDLYAFDWSLPFSKEQWHNLNLTYLPPWDVVLMLCLAVVIVVMITLRARPTTPHR